MFAANLVPRTRLLARLTDGLRVGHVLIEAPGGYGKTTLLHTLAAQRPFTYIHSLAPGKADPVILQSQLEARLREPGATLILDDVQLLDDEPDVLAWLADHLEQPLDRRPRFVLAGRHVALPNALLLATQNRLARLTSSDLAFNRSECRQFGIPDDWSRRVEGWPLALALYQQLSSQHAVPRAQLPVTEPLFDTLARWLLADLPPELRRFVMVTSVPLRFNLTLAADLLDLPEAQAAEWLSAAKRRALFLQPAEPAGWLRYHDLIREFLLTQHDTAQYWSRAVAWFEAQGDLPMAIEHALAGLQPAVAANLMERLGDNFVYETGLYRTYKRWVLNLGPAQQAAHPLLLVTLASGLQETSNRAESQHYLDLAGRYALSQDPETRAAVALAIATTQVSHGNLQDAQPVLDGLLADPSLSPVHRRQAYRALGGLYYYRSQLRAARRAYLDALAIDAETPAAATYRLRQNLVNVVLVPLGEFEEAQQQMALDETEVRPKLVAHIWHLLTVCWLCEAMGDWDAMRRALDELRQANLKTEEADLDDSAELMLRAIYHTGIGQFEAAGLLLKRIVEITTQNPDIELYTALCRSWLLRRQGDEAGAAAIAEQALDQPWDVPLTRGMLALEREFDLYGLGSTAHELHPQVRRLFQFRARHWMVRLRVLLALRCHAAGQPRWRRHAASVLRATRRYGYDRLLVTREPEMGAKFWALCVVEGLASETAMAALRQIGHIEPLLAWLRDESPVVRVRAARALAVVGDERAIPELVAVGGLSSATADPLEQALLALEHTPPPLLRVRLMGQFDVQRGQTFIPAAAWARPAARRLLQYFALHAGQLLPRDQILDDLWPNSSPAAARKLLNTTLSSMRKAIEPYLRPKSAARYFTVENETYAFAASTSPAAGRVKVDTVEFAHIVTDALRNARQQEVPEVSEALLAALTGWQPLLPDSPYDTWTLAPREALLDQYLRGCLFAATTWLEWRRFADAEHWARRVIAVSSYSEEAYQALMRAQARQGNRGQALHTYAEAVAALAREFDAPPSTLTNWLAARLRRDEEI